MSEQSNELREYGQALQADVASGTVIIGTFVIDCADRLERLEADREAIQVLMSRAHPCSLVCALKKVCRYAPEPAGDKA